jgi:hypothetical protein
MLLDGRLQPGQHVTVGTEGDQLSFSISQGRDTAAPAAMGQAGGPAGES